MNDLVLVQSFIDKKLEIQKAMESDLEGKININNRQDFPNFNPIVQKKPAASNVWSTVYTDKSTQDKQQKPQDVVVTKGRRKGKKKADPDKELTQYLKQNNGGFDFSQLDDNYYEDWSSGDNEDQSMPQKQPTTNINYDAKDYVDDDEEFLRIIEELKRKTALEAGVNTEEIDYSKFKDDEEVTKEDNHLAGTYLIEKSKKKENPIGFNGVKKNPNEQEDNSSSLFNEANKGKIMTVENNQKGGHSRANDIGSQILQLEEERKKGGGGGKKWSSKAHDYILSVSKDSEDLLLSLHSIFPRLALGRLKIFFSFLGENFDKTKEFLICKQIKIDIYNYDFSLIVIVEFKNYYMPENAGLSTQIRSPGDFQFQVGSNYQNDHRGLGNNNIKPKGNYIHSKLSKLANFLTKILQMR